MYTNLNGITQEIAKRIDIPMNDPLLAAYGYPLLASGVGGNADYGIRTDFLLYRDEAYAPTAIKYILKNELIRPKFYENAPYRLAGYYSNAMRPVDYKPELPGDQPDGTIIIDGYPVCANDLDHLPIHVLRDVADYKNVPITLKSQLSGVDMTLNSKDLAKLILAFNAKGTAGMLRQYYIGPGKKVDSMRSAAKIAKVFMNAADHNVLDPEDLHTFITYLTQTAIPFFENNGLVIGSFPYPNDGLSPIIAKDEKWFQFNELVLLVSYWYELKNKLQSIGQIGIAFKIETLIESWCEWVCDCTGADGSVPSFVTLSNSPKIHETLSNPINAHYTIYGTAPLKTEYSRWAYHALRIAELYGINDAKEKADKILAIWKVEPPQYSLLKTNDQEWMVDINGEYEKKS